MRHDSPQGERIGFWFHLAFAGMYALAFAWHIKGAREHARDMKKPQVLDVHIGQYADRDPKQGAAIDHAIKTGEPLFSMTAERAVEVYNQRMKREGNDSRRWFEKGEGRPTLEDLQEEDRRASL